ncbi:hypothetical protein BCR33DRAFT_735851 [Rhizoclosmatium globosum]|uniref:Uncharacterized protein n=1 Tax=Rhizoclosmatium globosum TaxID=329046 RepID=A0A1Y2CKW6_9FUNG|nr:hypothetical protein BCR33DRAFT_735851 [Rhizoclosmatium globosum]|eukprot:ORY47663.1 hypothetical protein BCR33DRAFT_735851 [Rhizoclosmatium globosum]
MAAFVQKVVDLEGAKSGPTSAIYQCLLSMVPEMVKCCEGDDTEEDWRTSSELEGVEISMTVTSLVGDEIEKVEKEPHSHLGLLGLDIAGGVRWKGNSEPAWRLFWKLND